MTGANAGIGFAAALQLADAGHRVLLGCRDAARGADAVTRIRAQVPEADVSVVPLDLSLRSSVRAAAASVSCVDVLIHNAAWFDLRVTKRPETAECVEAAWATNHIGPALLTELLMPRLLESEYGCVIAVTSKGLAVQPWLKVDLDDPEFRRRRYSASGAYYQSKLAHLAWMLHQAQRWRGRGVRFHGVRVTNVKLDLSRYPGLGWHLRAAYAVKSRFSIAPQDMARTYVWLATADSLDPLTGGYWDGIARPASPSRWAAAASHQAALATLTDEYLAR